MNALSIKCGNTIPAFHHGQIVYHAASSEHRGVVMAICINSDGTYTYGVSWSDLADRWHRAVELNIEKPIS